MSHGTKTHWKLLERWSARAFIAAGGLFLATAALFGLETFTDLSHPVWLTAVVGLSGLMASFVGLVGLYPGVASRVPRLARVGIATVATAVIALVAFPLCLYAKASGMDLLLPPTAFFVIAILTTVSGFLLFGVASLYTHIPSRMVGLLLVATVIMFLILFATDMMYGGAPGWLDFAVNGVQAVLLLAIGYLLPTDSTLVEEEEPHTEVISG